MQYIQYTCMFLEYCIGAFNCNYNNYPNKMREKNCIIFCEYFIGVFTIISQSKREKSSIPIFGIIYWSSYNRNERKLVFYFCNNFFIIFFNCNYNNSQ